MVMTQNCLSKVTNYASRVNAAEIPNNNTASFTYDLCVPDNMKMIMLDMSDLIAGQSVVNVDSTVTDGLSMVAYSGVPEFVFDVSTLDDSRTWRIDYTITTTSGDTNTATKFFVASQDAQTRGTSDPNRPPLREKNSVLATGVTGASCFQFTQSTPSTTWVVPHNTGNGQPCGFHIMNLAGTSMIMGTVIPFDANTVNVIFSIPLAGIIKLTF